MNYRHALRAALAAVLCLLLLLSLAGCGGKEDKRDTAPLSTTRVSEELNHHSEENTSEEMLLDAIYRQNRLDALLLNHRSVQRRTVCMDISGNEVFSATVYGDSRQYAYRDSKGNISVVASGSEVGKDASKNRPYMTSFYNNSYRNYAANIRNHIIFTGYDGEFIISASTEDKEFIVKTKVPMSSIDQSASDFNPGETFSAKDTCIIEYHMIPYLYEITSMDVFIVRSNGTTVNLMQTKITYDVPSYHLPASLRARLQEGKGVEQRTVK